MNILSLIESDGVKLTQHGKTFRGRCPFHGGKTETSLLVDADAGKYHCFGCDQHGDAIQWLRKRRGLSFVEACLYLGHDPKPRSSGPRPAPPKWEPRKEKAPAAAWQKKARAFLDGAVACLWSERGKTMRTWLHNKKGLSDATIKAAGLGLNLGDIYEPRATWGLEPSYRENGTERRQWIPAGLVIPHIAGNSVCRLRIRRDKPGDGPRYVVVSGSEMTPMAISLQDRAAAVIVESELDAILLNQEAGDLAGAISMGSTTAKPDKIIHDALIAAEVILVSLDSDEAGAKASWKFWPVIYGEKAKRWPCIQGKDPGDARLNGLDLRDWITIGIFTTFERFERFCIQTIDGGLSDSEAIKAMGGGPVDLRSLSR